VKVVLDKYFISDFNNKLFLLIEQTNCPKTFAEKQKMPLCIEWHLVSA